MPWLRIGDTASTDQRVLALHDRKDPTLGLLCWGFFTMLGTLSAQQQTDYVITPGFVDQAGGDAGPRLLRRCIQAGLITPLGGTGKSRRWKLIDDAPELLHIRLKDEVAWEKQQKADTQNPAFQEVVWLRDGDSCRYCGKVVQPFDTRSARGKTLDHLRSGQPARGPEDLVVACRGCNGRRGREWQDAQADPVARDEFEQRWQLRPPPQPLIFIRSTATWLAERGRTIPAGSVIAERANPKQGTPVPAQTSGPDATHPAAEGVAAPDRNTPPDVQRAATQAVPAATDGTAQGATHPQRVAAPPPTDPSRPPPSAPAATHPANAGVAAAESRNDHRSATDRSGAGRDRVGSVDGSGGHPPTRASPDLTDRSSGPRRTRRGRRRTSSGRQP